MVLVGIMVHSANSKKLIYKRPKNNTIIDLQRQGMRILKYIAIFFAITIGFYPIAYLVSDMDEGLLNTKDTDLFNNLI